jgi:membrane associated rhomboid family serine protease
MDYYQRPKFNSPVVRNLLIANFAMYALSYLVRKSQGFDLDSVLGLFYYKSANFKPHQFITFLFMHDPNNILHIAFNMWGLWIFGKILETHWGSKKFFTYYMICGIGSGMTQQLAWYYMLHGDNQIMALQPDQYQFVIDHVSAIGASGAIFGLLLAFGMIFPNVPLQFIFVPIPIKAKYLVIGYGLYELFGGITNSSGDNVAHFAHIGGLITGFIIIMIWKRKQVFH